jgi:putative NADPH-quinone reductase
MSGSHWALPALMKGLHDKVWQELQTARAAIGHTGAKGDGSEKVWHRLLGTYLPARYAVDKATIMDSTGAFSGEIDVVLYDRQYTFLIFELEGVKVIPAEAVYAVFEAKQEINAAFVAYAQKKAASVRRLHRSDERRGDDN